MKQLNTFFRAFNSYISLIILNYIFLFLIRLWEVIMVGTITETVSGFAGDIILVNLALMLIYIPYALLWLWKPKTAVLLFGVLMGLFYLLSLPLQAYYNITGEIISAIDFNCSSLQAWVFALKNIPVISFILPFVVFLALAIYLVRTILRQTHVFPKIAVNFFAFLLIIAIPAGFELGLNSDFFTKNEHRINKPFHFAAFCMSCTFGSHQPEIDEVSEIERYQSIRGAEAYISDDEFPLLRKVVTDPCLSPYFRETDNGQPPNVVLIVMEGLGSKFLDPVHEISFMPFLEGLKQQSLYWKNFLSTSDSLQNTMGSILGGLPYGDRGFAILPIMPRHFSVVNVLGFNNYHTSFFTGRHAWIHSTDKLLTASDIDAIWHAPDFGSGFNAIRTGSANRLWGYNDRDLVKLFFEKRSATQKPTLEILYTGSMHNPWPVDNKEYYREKFRNLIPDNNMEHRAHFEQFEDQYISLMFTDDAIRDFFRTYSGMGTYNNTIFIITGNYPMRMLTSGSRLEKYHVPLMIYSPMLNQSRNLKTSAAIRIFMTALFRLWQKNLGLQPLLTPHHWGIHFVTMKIKKYLSLSWTGKTGSVNWFTITIFFRQVQNYFP
jgi:phosphoglycerol transferase MdoB-like AlkP superfamily enzyme